MADQVFVPVIIVLFEHSASSLVEVFNFNPPPPPLLSTISILTRTYPLFGSIFNRNSPQVQVTLNLITQVIEIFVGEKDRNFHCKATKASNSIRSEANQSSTPQLPSFPFCESLYHC